MTKSNQGRTAAEWIAYYTAKVLTSEPGSHTQQQYQKLVDFWQRTYLATRANPR